MIPEENPIARTSDPVTSHDAAAQVTDGGERQRMMRVAADGLLLWPGLTAKELEAKLGYSDGAIRKRLNDLRLKGEAHTGPARKCTLTGKLAMTWHPGPAPKDTLF